MISPPFAFPKKYFKSSLDGAERLAAERVSVGGVQQAVVKVGPLPEHLSQKLVRVGNADQCGCVLDQGWHDQIVWSGTERSWNCLR